MANDAVWEDVKTTPGLLANVAFCAAMFVVSLILAVLSLAIPHDGVLAAMWLPNAVILAAVLSSRSQLLPAALLGAGAGLLLGEIASRVPLDASLILTGANVAEVAVAALLVRRLCGERVDFTDPATFFRFVAAMTGGVVASFAIALVAVPGAGALFVARHASGLVFITPLTMVAISAWRKRGQGGNLVPIPVLVTIIFGTLAIFWQSSFPFLFLVTPLVVLAGISSGMGGTAFVLVLMATIGTAATAVGSGPMTLTRGEPGLQFVTLQLFLASLTLVGLPLAGLIERGIRDREELRRSRDEKRSLLDNIDEVIFSIANDGTWLTLNAAWDRITGRRRETSIGEPYDQFLPPAERARIGQEMAKLRAGLITVLHIELAFERPDGEERYVQMRMRCTRDDAGRTQGVIGHMRDVSDEATGRIALEASERKFATLAELAPAGLFLTNARGECTWVNRSWQESTGMLGEEWRGHGWADAIHPDDFDRVYYGWMAATSARSTFTDTWRWLRPDGSVVWLTCAAAPQFDAEGRLTGHIGINMDITEVRLAEAELAERERQIKTITDNVRDALFMVKADGTCNYASPYAGAMFDREPESLIDRSFAALFGKEAHAAIDQRLRPLWSGEERSCAFQFRMDESAGGRWMDAHLSAVPADDGVHSIVASVRDISEAKQLEVDLTKARRKAEHAAQAKAAFLANMSHEIRTPMNGVIGFTDLLLQSDLNATQHRHAQLIADSGRAMMRLLNDILDMSKIDSGKLTLVPAPVDLRAKVATCVSLLQPVADNAGIAIESRVDNDVPARLLGDPLRLRQILLNLIGNAVKFTERGQVSVHARTEPGPDGRILAISVADTGIGIAPERLSAIFEHFRQADVSIARKYGGTGLGLAISNQLARLMGGKIDVVSELDEGTTFTVRIPLLRAQAEDAATPTADVLDKMVAPVTAPLPALRQRLGERPRVLVAEDNDINQELVLAMARNAGLDPDLASEGSEAIAMVKAAHAQGRPYRLILMDMQMPGVDGLEATRRLRQAGFEPDMLPIVALTANCFAEDIAACHEAGMQGHLAKPLQMPALSQAVHTYLAPESDSGAEAKTEVVDAVIEEADPLAVRYRERKGKLLSELAEVAAGQGEAQWDVLAMQLHKLAGTAGYFGESRLGELARSLEDQLRSAEDANARLALLRSEWETMKKVA